MGSCLDLGILMSDWSCRRERRRSSSGRGDGFGVEVLEVETDYGFCVVAGRCDADLPASWRGWRVAVVAGRCGWLSGGRG